MRSIDLLHKAEQTVPSMRALSESLGLTPTALGKAKNDGRLSPAIAAALAAELGQDPGTWALVAASESAKNPAALQRRLSALVRRIHLFLRLGSLAAAVPSLMRSSAQRTLDPATPNRRPISA